jgi:hypothetical protein
MEASMVMVEHVEESPVTIVGMVLIPRLLFGLRSLFCLRPEMCSCNFFGSLCSCDLDLAIGGLDGKDDAADGSLGVLNGMSRGLTRPPL